ncbi:glutamine synthetase [Alphaproteobacteria bacterium]
MDTDHNLKTSLLFKLLGKLADDYQLYPAIGAEVEFYLLDFAKNPVLMSNDCLADFFLTNLNIVGEKGIGQYEFNTGVFYDLENAIKAIEERRSSIKKLANDRGVLATFCPKPFANNYGSALHVHLSLHRSAKVSYNFFSAKEIRTNELLLHCIAGILALLNGSLYLLTGDNMEEFERFVPQFMAPVNVSWGINNRSTAIRIPNSHSSARRLEFRVSSAQSETINTVIFLLAAILYGIRNKLYPMQPVYGNAADDVYELTPLHANLEAAKRNFDFYQIVANLL